MMPSASLPPGRPERTWPVRFGCNEQLGWAYDAAGNLRYRTNGGLIQTFTMDPVNQLTNVARNSTMTLSGAMPAPAASVTVDGQAAQTYGDFTFAMTNVSLSNGTNTFSIAAHSVTGTNSTNILTLNLPSSVSLLYDSNGNLTNDGTRSFAYSAENQLTNVTVSGVSRSDFVYDGLGKRRIAREYTNSSGAWMLKSETHYVYDGWLLMQERDASNNVLVTYTRGLDLSSSLQGAGGIGGLLARTDGNGSTFYHADGAGNITSLMDGQQNVAARYMYNPFGRLTGMWGPMGPVNRMQFSSWPTDPSGLSHAPLRDYDPNWKWLTQDPIGEAGGINLHGFVRNNPLRYIDPYGLQAVQLELDLEMERAEPEPIHWGPGQMPDEELLRARDDLLRRGAPSDMALSQGEPEPTSGGNWLSRLLSTLGDLFKQRCPAKGTGPIQKGDITTYQDLVMRSVVGDKLEGHELWQHANLRANGLADERLSTEASRQNPVIALDQATHQQVNAAQRAIDAASQTPMENIDVNAAILRSLSAAQNKIVDQLEQMAIQHARNYGH